MLDIKQPYGRQAIDPTSRITYNQHPLGPLAQWLEQATHNRLVVGSNPTGATKFYMLIQTLKPPFTVAFLFHKLRMSPFCPLRGQTGADSIRINVCF